jgi:hypothetical protein
MHLVKYATSVTIHGLKLVAAGSSDYQSNPTLASGDVKVTKDGGSETNLATLPVVAPASSKNVSLTLSSAETQCRIVTVNFIDQTGTKEWADNSFQFYTYGHPSAFLPFDFSTGAVSLLSGQVDQLVTEFWAAQRSTNNVPGSFGEGVASVQGNVTGNLNGTVAEILSIDSGVFDDLADAILDNTNGVESGLTLRQALRLIVAAAAGKVAGATTTTVTIRNVQDTKTVITATVDGAGNRTALTYDVT